MLKQSKITLITCCREFCCATREYLDAEKKSGGREDLGSFTGHLCIFRVVSYKWSLLPIHFTTSVGSVLLGRQNCVRHLEGRSSDLIRITPKECLQKSRAGRATLVLQSLGSWGFQHPCVRNKRQPAPRKQTQAQGNQAYGAHTDEEETFKSSRSTYRVQSPRPGDIH